MRGCACKTARVLPRDCSGAWSAATVCGGRGALWGFVADECEHVCETYPEHEGSLMCVPVQYRYVRVCARALIGRRVRKTPRTPDRWALKRGTRYDRPAHRDIDDEKYNFVNTKIGNLHTHARLSSFRHCEPRVHASAFTHVYARIHRDGVAANSATENVWACSHAENAVATSPDLW